MAKGKIAHWTTDRGFGFIRPLDGGRDIFLHISDIRHDAYEPKVGDEVSYSLKQGSKGRPQAAGAVIAGVPRASRNWATMLAAPIPVIFLTSLYLMVEYRMFLLPYLIMSTATLIAYGVDKHRAKTGGWRKTEPTLQLYGLLGGWPGAILAQMLFRHKTRKLSFQLLFWSIVAIHVGFWTWLQKTGLSPDELILRAQDIVDLILR